MPLFDFFAAPALPVPAVDEAGAAALGSRLTGRDVRAKELGSQQDANFLLSDGNEVVGVLKVANVGFGDEDADAQDAVADHLAAALPDLRFATALPGTRGYLDQPGGTCTARVLRFLPGGTLHGSAYLAPAVVTELGALVGRASVALRDVEHPALHRTLQWDLQHAARALDVLADHVTDPVDRARVQQVRDEAWPLVEAADLPRQAVHGDITDDNVVCREVDGLRVPDGVIDFGDVVHTWAVGELAICISSLLHHHGMTPVGALRAAAAFHQVRPLSEDEADALWPLVALRGAVLVASGYQQTSLDGDANAYAIEGLEQERRILAGAVAVPVRVMQHATRLALGLPAVPADLPSGHGPLARLGSVAVLDLSVDGDLDGGRWLEPDIEQTLALEALQGADAVVARAGEHRLTRSVPLSRTAPATVATGLDLWTAAPVELTAPWAGRLQREGDGTVLVAATHRLHLARVEPLTSGDVEIGSPLGRLEARTRLRVTVSTAADAVPEFVVPELAAAWRGLVADPAPLLGLHTDSADPAAVSHELLARREHSLAEVQEHYYAAPPQIERGWREHLVATDGRSYLDMVNNVAALGHGDVEMADAVAGQLRRFNSNSRFHYRAVVEFSQALTATLPEPLDTVFLVNSGSEAVDLGLRIAMAATGRRDVWAVAEAYHGWTYASDAVSTSIADNPNALDSRPDWVHVLDTPNHFRGRHRDGDATAYAGEAVARIDALAAGGTLPAGFIAEPVYGNAGGMALPEGYLAAVYAAVRRHGGLAIADEVQVGYGRLGHWFWGFEQQGVVPDVVTVAKAMGNGHPLGAVITSKAVADRYRTQGYFFSSAGGSPVSSVVGSVVLDRIRGGLQANAREVGDHLHARLHALADRHEVVGAVHGFGLYAGVELVTDRTTRAPATARTARLCDRLLDLGVLMQPTGDGLNILKVKPPLVLTRESADFFVDALDHALSTGS
ncbi:4-aminobutyrate aminotransferase [Klenkia marina]|uniref:4-aminobutyrate aminotransferase n=1 Tax=Klenkia marina TaxID=1960309 RepID=A0A1G4XSZ1_9ACTN|nr:aminotransferase [Klenkia marina]SCX44329.1 4-aminobutyrate aminotransferase [Klenkia marina]